MDKLNEYGGNDLVTTQQKKKDLYNLLHKMINEQHKSRDEVLREVSKIPNGMKIYKQLCIDLAREATADVVKLNGELELYFKENNIPDLTVDQIEEVEKLIGYNRDLRSMQQKVDDLRNLIINLKKQNKTKNEIKKELSSIPNIDDIWNANINDIDQKLDDLLAGFKKGFDELGLDYDSVIKIK